MTELWQFEIKSVTYTCLVTFKSNSKSDKVDLANKFIQSKTNGLTTFVRVEVGPIDG